MAGYSKMWAAGVLLIAPCVAAWAALLLHGLMDRNARWVEHAPIKAASASGERVFKNLLENGVIWIERSHDVLRIVTAECSAVTRLAPSQAILADGHPAAYGAKERVAQVEELCTTDQGARVRDDITRFNSSLRLVALRDDRSRTLPAADGRVGCAVDGRVDAYVTARGCFPTAWRMRNLGATQDLPVLDDRYIPTDEYWFLAKPPRPGFGDWAVLPLADRNAEVIAETALAEKLAGGVRLQVIGVPVAMQVNGTGAWIPLPVPDGAGNWSVAVGGLRLRGNTRCAPGLYRAAAGVLSRDKDDEGAICDASDAAGRPISARIDVEGVAASLKLKLQPSVILPRILREAAAKGRLSRREGQLSLTCLTEWAGSGVAKGVGEAGPTGCGLKWATSGAVERGAPRQPVLTTAGGEVALLEADGRLSAAALELEMQRIVGFGVEDRGSLAARLSGEQYAAAQAPELTIDAHMQRAALAALDAQLGCADPRLCSKRGEMVLISADPATAGDILAVASRPSGIVGLSDWDVRSLELEAPVLSPIAGHGWRIMDVHSRPGSGFKMITSLAAIDVLMKERNPVRAETLHRLLAGEMSPDETARTLGLRHTVVPGARGQDCETTMSSSGASTALPVRTIEFTEDRRSSSPRVYCMANSSAKRSLADHALNPALSKCASGNKSRIGICEAMIKSSNLYFAGLSLFIQGIDPNDPNSVPTGNPSEDYPLVRMARRLFPVVADDGRLGFHAEGLLRNDADSGRVPRLVASPFQLDLEVNEPIFRKFELAQAGIGQGVAASPLAMATAAASVALGELISPRLLSTTVRQARMPLIAAPPGMEQQRDALLAQLRQGMYGVVNVAGGTMYNNRLQVRPLKKKGIRFWAKTGTLTLDKDTKTYAAWLIGWAEAPDSRRVAFACLIAPSTHYGGEECGPVVAQTLAKALEPTP